MNMKLESVVIAVPAEMRTLTRALVREFAEALAQKLSEAELKNGWEDEWTGADPAALRESLRDHIKKGDPRDVGAFCAFLWALGASTNGR
jgi:hypothetical protein